MMMKGSNNTRYVLVGGEHANRLTATTSRTNVGGARSFLRWIVQPRSLLYLVIGAFICVYILSIISTWSSLGPSNHQNQGQGAAGAGKQRDNDDHPSLHHSLGLLKSNRMDALRLAAQQYKNNRNQNNQQQEGEGESGDDVKSAVTLPPGNNSLQPFLSPLPILVFTYNRPEELRKTLENLIRVREITARTEAEKKMMMQDGNGGDLDSLLDKERRLYPIYISQDGFDPFVLEVCREFVAKGKKKDSITGQDNTNYDARYVSFHLIVFNWSLSGVSTRIPTANLGFTHYYKISTHYGWALRQVLDGGRGTAGGVDQSRVQDQDSGSKSFRKGFDNILIVEDDMDFAPDTLFYFRTLLPVLENDQNLLCVSGWNDNGRSPLVSPSLHQSQLYRSECFPGLGWVLTRRLWDEYKVNWPLGFWDDWIREPAQRKGRACIYPEVNRIYTFGEKGSSAGMFYEQYLKGIELNQKPVQWEKETLEYISSKDHYKSWLNEKISQSRLIPSTANALPSYAGEELRVEYSGIPDLDRILESKNMMTNHKAGIPRTSFEGILSYSFRGNGGSELPGRVWIVPKESPYLIRGRFP